MMPHLERIHTNSDGILPLLLFALMTWLVWKIYHRDSVELHPFWRVLLPVLRTGVLLALLWIFLQPQWVSEKERKMNSRFLVFCDTSLSMTLPEDAPRGMKNAGTDSDSTENSTEPRTVGDASETQTRAQFLAELWKKTPLLQRLNEKHDLVFLALDSESRVVWTAEKGALSAENGSETSGTGTSESSEKAGSAAGNTGKSAPIPQPDWNALLLPKGTQSRLCDAVREWVLSNSTLPISGILLCSDGVQTSGGEMQPLVETARKQRIPIYTLGLGSTQVIENYRLTEMEAPSRVLPRDPFVIRASVDGFGFETRKSENGTHIIQVDLFQKKLTENVEIPGKTALSENVQTQENVGTPEKVQTPEKAVPSSDSEGKTEETSGKDLSTETLIATEDVILSEEGKQTAFQFTVPPQPVGKYLFTMRVRPGENEMKREDNERDAEIDVMDRKTRVLIFAGGPTREYQFLSTMFFRDKNVETDILLQSALPGGNAVPKNAEEEKALRARIQQDAARILLRFPDTREELFVYDCILAVDPNWKVLTPSQADWVEEWTARQGGGLIFVAGPVYMGMVGGWMDDTTLGKIQTLYPVEFYDRTSSSRQNTFTADEIWPLEWTRAGKEASYFLLDDAPATSARLWSEFPGVYGHFPTKKLRSGATALAYFSNPQTRFGDSAPILLATQFYGSGRTLYIGTGEFWRLRAQNPEYFTRLYTQLLNYVTQGRTIQQSLRGRLMLEQTRCYPGDPIEIRAQLFDPALQPLDAAATPEVSAEVFLPNGKIQSVPLTADRAMPGLYTGRFSVMTEGRLRIELPVPDSSERLVRRIEVVLSDVEREKPQRNQAFLDELAQKTGGIAFETPNTPEFLAFPDALRDRTRTLVEFDSAVPVLPPQVLMYVLIALLSLEWLLRRVLKLA